MKLDATDMVPCWGVERVTDGATYWKVDDAVNHVFKESIHGAAHSTTYGTTRAKTYWTTYGTTDMTTRDATVEFMEN